MVYDASAKLSKNGRSLNECLHVGPSLTPLLYDVLLRLIIYPIVLFGDIQKAFLQIESDPCDTDALRFLWYENPKDLNEVKEYRLTRNIFGCGPSPYVLAGTMKHHLAKYQEESPGLVKHKESLHVDDYTGGTMTYWKYLESSNK